MNIPVTCNKKKIDNAWHLCQDIMIQLRTEVTSESNTHLQWQEALTTVKHRHLSEFLMHTQQGMKNLNVHIMSIAMVHIQLILIHCIWHMTGKKKSGFFTFKVHIWQPHTVARQCSVDNVHITLSKLVEHAMVPWHGMHFQTHLHGEHNSKLEGMYTLGDVNWHQLHKSCMHFIGLYCNPVCLTLTFLIKNQYAVMHCRGQLLCQISNSDRGYTPMHHNSTTEMPTFANQKS